MSEAVSLLRVLDRGPMGMLRRNSAVGSRDLALDLLAFAGTVACATIFRWEARDVIWGLWISSLTVGYATIVWQLSQNWQLFPLAVIEQRLVIEAGPVNHDAKRLVQRPHHFHRQL